MARADVANDCDYYSILEVTPTASAETIRESYRRLALRFHPDKNRDAGATRDFQRLGIAWETLRDVGRRIVYDRDYYYSGFATRRRGDGRGNAYWCGNNNQEEEGVIDIDMEVESRLEEVNRRREEVDREATARWNQTRKSPPCPSEPERRERARKWKEAVRKDYTSRLQSWMIFRDSHLLQIKDRQTLLRRNHADLEAQLRVPEEEMIRMFQDAIERSRQIGHKIQDHAATLSRLLAARDNYINTMTHKIQENQDQIKALFCELEIGRRRYEDEETHSREHRCQQALEILGPWDLNPPLFSMIDRRGQAINRWKALSRVKAGAKLFTTLESASEGPWHVAGDWERIGGEHACERCLKAAFHIMLECGPARCPGCGTVVCHDCDRDLQLLREYDHWVRGGLDDREAFFAIEFGGDCDGDGGRRKDFAMASEYGAAAAL